MSAATVVDATWFEPRQAAILQSYTARSFLSTLVLVTNRLPRLLALMLRQPVLPLLSECSLVQATKLPADVPAVSRI
jgi:hypothetical protein